MKKDIQRAALAVIIGTLAVMTGCDQSNNSNMKGHGTNGKNGKMQDGTTKQETQEMDQNAKPKPKSGQSQMNDQSQQMQGGSTYHGGKSGNKSSGSQYHRYSN